MKKYLWNHFVLLVVLLSLFAFRTQAQFRIDLQFRPRFEFRDGYQKLASEGSTPGVLVSQRTRIGLMYEKDFLKFKFTPQDVRLWGDEKLMSSTGVFGDSSSLDLLEAYGELKLGNIGWISVGRQQLKYDNYRLLGDRNWNQNGISYDAVVLKLSRKEFNLHIGAVWNTLTEAGTENLYPSDRLKSINFLWINKRFSENLSASLIHVASGVTQTDTTSKLNFRQTTGFYIENKSDGLNFWADAYYQYGKNQKGMPISAYLFGATISYNLDFFTPAAGFLYLSGNSKTGTDQKEDNLFDVLYGNRHRFYGYIDYFRNFPKDTKQGGLIDFNCSLALKLNSKISIQEIGHVFSLAQINPNTPVDKELGYENDLVVKYNFSDWGGLEGGYSFFLPTSTLRTIQNIQENKFSQFLYLQLVITTNLFKQL